MPMKVCYTVVNGEVLSENRGGVKRDYLPDTQGNVIGLIDNTQTITDTFSYYPYGEVASRTGTTATPFQFLGTLGYYQDSSSRTYVRARTLNTAQGRWMTQDPIGFAGGDYNLYRYVNNKPTVLVDPSGLGGEVGYLWFNTSCVGQYVMVIPETGQIQIATGYQTNKYYEVDGVYVMPRNKNADKPDVLKGTEYKIDGHTWQRIDCDPNKSTITVTQFKSDFWGWLARKKPAYEVPYGEFHNEPNPKDKKLTSEERKSCKKLFPNRDCVYLLELYVTKVG